MFASRQNAIPPSTSAFTCAMGHGLQVLPSDDVDQLLASATLIDIHDASSVLGFAVSSSDSDLSDATKGGDVPTFGMMQLKSGLVWLYQSVTALVVQITTIASDVVSLKDRVTAVESTPLVIHSQKTEAFTRQVGELCERLASQEGRIAAMEISHRAETDSYKKTIQELTVKVDDDTKSRDDALEKLRDSQKYLGFSIESQGARITGVKADVALKISLLQKELAGIRAELTAAKTLAWPANASPASPVIEAPKSQIRASVVEQRDTEVIGGFQKLCSPPSVILRSSTRAPDVPAVSNSLSGQSITPSNQGEIEELKDKIARKPLTAASANAVRPGADKISVIPMIPRPSAIMERLISMKGKGKENKPCNISTSTTTLQENKMFKPGAGQSPDVSQKLATASPKARCGTGLVAKISALPKPRMSLLPAPRKSLLPSLVNHSAFGDGSVSNEVETANRLPGGSETQTKKPKTNQIAAISTPRPPLGSALSRVVEKEPAVNLPASSSLVALDVALQAMETDGNDLLALTLALNCSNDDSSFSGIIPKGKRKAKNESENVALQQRNVDTRSLLTPPPTRPGNNTSLPASSSLVALEAAVKKFQDGGEILTLAPVPGVDFSLSATTPAFKRESIYTFPVNISGVKPSRRL